MASTNTPIADAAKTQPVDAAKKVIEGSAETAAAAAATKAQIDNGATAIGTSVKDTGAALKNGAAETALTTHGLNHLKIAAEHGEMMRKDLRGLLCDKPSEAQKDATIKDLGKKVDDSKSIPDDLKQSVKDIEAGLIKGNINAVGGSIHALEKNADPTALKKVLDAVNQGLEGTGVKFAVENGKNGENVVAYGRGGDQAIVFSPDGSASVHAAKRIEAGGFTLGGKVVGGESAAGALEGLADRVVRRLNDAGSTQEMTPNRPPSDHPFPGYPREIPDGPGGGSSYHGHKGGNGLETGRHGITGPNYRYLEQKDPKPPADGGRDK